MFFCEWIAWLRDSYSQMSCFNTSKNWLGAETIFTVTKISFRGCISRPIHFFIGSIEDFVPPAGIIKFGKYETFFAFHVVVDVCIIFWVDELGSVGWSAIIFSIRDDTGPSAGVE